MEMNPVNLAFRFALEIIALMSVGMWGWRFSDQWSPYVLAIGIPVVLAIVWGTFSVPGDPSRSGGAPIVIPGGIRLAIELCVFAFAAWVLCDIGYIKIGLILACAVIIHYFISYKRIMWLLSH